MKFEYEIVYSRRRSVGISVTSENKVILRCPIGMPKARAEKFLYEKQGWVERALNKNAVKLDAYSDVISFEYALIKGVKVPLIIGSKKTEITENGVFVKDIKNIKRLYLKTFEVDFNKRVKNIAQTCGFNLNGLTVKNYKSRWGCCDSKNNISFNYKLFMLPQYVSDYVIIHELCHTVHHNHSKEFWRLVAKFVPDYSVIKKDLKGYDFLTTLY